MKTRDEIIEDIHIALSLGDPKSAPAELREALADLDDHGLGTLHGITGVFLHARAAKMPARWLRTIYEDLLDAFSALVWPDNPKKAARKARP